MNKATFFRTIFSLLLIFTTAIFAGCSDDKSKEPETGGGEPVTPYIRVAPATLTFEHDGTAVDGDTFTIETNCTWSISVESGKEWLHLSATKGEGSDKVTVTIPQPVETGDEAELTFTATNKKGETATQKVTVVQYGDISVLPVIVVTPSSLTFDSEGKALDGDKFTIKSNCTWTVTVEPGKEWVTLSATEGTNDGSITVTTTANATRRTAELTFTATNTDGVGNTQKVSVVQNAASVPPLPAGEVTITADFQLGATIATPELPPYSKDNFVTGRHEYTIGGYPFAIFVNAVENGKFYWIDNTQFNPSIPAPNKGLFFSKLGAYIEFPALAGKVLSEVSYLPTTQQNTQHLEMMMTDGTDAPSSATNPADGEPTIYTMIEPLANAAYRIQVTDSKNAQCAKLVLKYVDAE